MTPDRIRELAARTGLSVRELAAALRMAPGGERDIRRWLSGDKDISGPASVALEALADGWKPRQPASPFAALMSDDQVIAMMLRDTEIRDITRVVFRSLQYDLTRTDDRAQFAEAAREMITVTRA